MSGTAEKRIERTIIGWVVGTAISMCALWITIHKTFIVPALMEDVRRVAREELDRATDQMSTRLTRLDNRIERLAEQMNNK